MFRVLPCLAHKLIELSKNSSLLYLVLSSLSVRPSVRLLVTTWTPHRHRACAQAALRASGASGHLCFSNNLHQRWSKDRSTLREQTGKERRVWSTSHLSRLFSFSETSVSWHKTAHTTHLWPWTTKPVLSVHFSKLRCIHQLNAE